MTQNPLEESYQMKISTIREDKTISKLVRRTLIIIFWVFIWELSSLFINNEILLPSPKKVFENFNYSWN